MENNNKKSQLNSNENKDLSEKLKFLNEEFRSGYQIIWDNKKNLEDKAMNLISISSILGAIIFGFGSIIFSTSTSAELLTNIDSSLKIIIFSIIVISMLSALFSVTFALYAIKLREYFFMIGSKDNRKIDKILEEKQELFEKYLSEETYNTALKNFTSTYINYNEQNFKNNEKKADYITKSFYLMLTTIGLITLALILLFSSFMITIL